MGTARTVSQTGSKERLIAKATPSFENNTVLAKRAFVQQNCSSSLPIIWKSSTGLPDFADAVQASAKVACHLTLPGCTVGLAGSPAGAVPDSFAITFLVDRSTTRFGLSTSVFGRDLDHAWAVADRVRAGMVHVNDGTALHECHVPFGGTGASGLGEDLGGRASIDLLTERRWTSLQRSVLP